MRSLTKEGGVTQEGSSLNWNNIEIVKWQRGRKVFSLGQYLIQTVERQYVKGHETIYSINAYQLL